MSASLRFSPEKSKMCFFCFFCPPGALYPDGTSNSMKMDDAVPPGGSYTYRWEVKKEFAPTDDDANCLTWVYHSHLDAPKDIAAGLIGALLTCKQGKTTRLCFCHSREKIITLREVRYYWPIKALTINIRK